MVMVQPMEELYQLQMMVVFVEDLNQTLKDGRVKTHRGFESTLVEFSVGGK